MNTNNRAIDAVLNKLEKYGHLTSDGRDWLVAACDPFHDSDIALAGYPDLTTASTVVQLVKKQIQITVPTTGPGIVTVGSNWDCSVALFGSPTPQGMFNYALVVSSNSAYSTMVGASGVVAFGGASISAGPSGNALWPSSTVLGPAASQQSLGCPEYIKGNCRIIGQAFEIVNTTAEINKQGQLTAWRMPNVTTRTAYVNSISGVVGLANLDRMPPATISDANLLYGSRSWAASEGAYVVGRFSDVENPMQQPTAIPITASPFDIPAGTSFLPAFPVYTAGTTLINPPIVGPDIHSPLDTSGIHLTGLSYNTTLTLTVRWLIERMPGPQETDLVVLATPSPMYDPLALELYTKCMHDMPPGVMLKENPLGEWFKAALSKAADWLPRLGDALNIALPGAAAVGTALGTLSRAGANLIPAEKTTTIWFVL
jgi:hypothetical protein